MKRIIYNCDKCGKKLGKTGHHIVCRKRGTSVLCYECTPNYSAKVEEVLNATT